MMARKAFYVTQVFMHIAFLVNLFYLQVNDYIGASYGWSVLVDLL